MALSSILARPYIFTRIENVTFEGRTLRSCIAEKTLSAYATLLFLEQPLSKLLKAISSRTRPSHFNCSNNDIAFSILIKASCTAGNLENAMSLFEQLKREGLVLDEIAFNCLLNGCSRNNKVA